MTTEELLRSKVTALNNQDGNLPDYDCRVCRNKGVVYYSEGGTIRGRECECMAQRRNAKRLRKSGLTALLLTYTMDSYLADTDTSKAIKAKASEYIARNHGWFVIAGNSGSGKTHICTAICGELMKQGKDLKYMLWREDAPKLKSLVNSRDEYEAAISDIFSTEVLYIDDFLKGNVTDADINLAFEIINRRYNEPSKLTLISTERSIQEILDIDEAVGSRIYERSKGYCLSAPKENRRLE